MIPKRVFTYWHDTKRPELVQRCMDTMNQYDPDVDVIVINAGKLHFHPTKHRRKIYIKHTGYIGHMKTWSLQSMIDKKPTQMIELAVKGMLPKNRLSRKMLKRLHVYADDQHTHEAQKPKSLSLSK